MPKKASKNSSNKEVTTSFGPRLKPPKPIFATGLILVGVLQFVATFDYRSDQEGIFHAIARQTSGFGSLNLIGKLGSDIGFLSLLSLGLISLILAPICLQFAYLLYLRRPKQVTLVQLFGLILLIIAGTGFFDFSNQHFWQQTFEKLPEDYLPNAAGGTLGQLLYHQWLGEFIGPVGSGILFIFGFGLGLYLTFSPTLNTLYRWVCKIKIPLPRFPERKPKPVSVPEPEDKQDQELPTDLKAKRQWLKPLFGKPMVESNTEELKSSFYYQDNNKPNEKYLEELGKPMPIPQPIPTKTPRRESVAKIRLIEEEPPVTDLTAEPEAKSIPEPEAKPPSPKPVLSEKHVKTSVDSEIAKVTIVESEKTEKDKLVTPKKRGQYKFPPIDLLEASEELPVDASTDHQAVAERLRGTLDDFKIKVELGEVHIGPVITRYDLHPAPGVRVEKIAALEKNITMSLQAQSVRILAPVPGKGCVGIEIPNRVPQSVRVRDILETKVWTSANAEIPIVLGKDVSGKPLVADLTRMPHLLIAGSTGSGKTVCINAIICSLLYHSSPEDVRFIMVDPKIVEMKIFNDLPHMLIPVVTDPKRVPNALKWLISEMENRYQIFAKVGVRNIAGFNARILKNQEAKNRAQDMDAELTAEERAAVSRIEIPRDDDAFEIPEKKLPYIVCIIDELADLMMVAPADIETCVARLAQLARAAGIHLIIATQRPSVNVITGVIKANLPSRISFKVASKIDSRTILDGGGADALIGRGDMLFIPPGIHHLVRAQGAFVSDEEIAEIVEYLKVNGPPEILEHIQKQIESDPDDDGGPTTSADTEDWGDSMVPDAIEVLRNTKRASTSMLQRRLRIGYNRAARIMEILEERGIVGPDNGSQPREILTDLDNL